MSTTVTKAVCVKGAKSDDNPKGKVADLDIIQYESCQEAIDAKDEKFILALINAQTITNAMNVERATHREGTAGKKKRYELAFNLLPTLTINDKSGMDLLIECAGSKEKLDELLASEAVQAAVDTKIGEGAA